MLLHRLIEFDPLLVGHMLIIPFAGHVVRLSKTTFGSFVVRDLIERCAPWDAAIVIEEILSHPHSDIVHLAKDKIGNNVICFAVHHSEVVIFLSFSTFVVSFRHIILNDC